MMDMIVTWFEGEALIDYLEVFEGVIRVCV